MSVAFLGLGEMGLPMAANLARAGVAVQGFDPRPERAAQLAEFGGEPRPSAAEAADGAEAAIAIVFDGRQCREALLGPGGALEQLPTSAPVMVMSTIGVDAMRSLAAEVQGAGYQVVDAPVTGGAHGARSGTLTIIAAGAPAALDAADPLFRPMSGQVYRVGSEPGTGQFVKLINQLLVGVHLAATAEAMAMGQAAGIDLGQLYEVLCHGFGRSDVFVQRARAVIEGNLKTGGSLAIFQKDMALVLQAAGQVGVPAFAAASAQQYFQLAAAAGHGAEDDAALIQMLVDLAAHRQAL
ncbi:MAG: NAD(P)-dependent oxidoreductase [Chloroflexi bacterium]|nr:NAD(P)-dependent oxidoreductase [Chloroflexota bacterium]